MASQPIFVFMPTRLLSSSNPSTNSLHNLRATMGECLRKSFTEFSVAETRKREAAQKTQRMKEKQNRQNICELQIFSRNEEKQCIKINKEIQQITVKQHLQKKPELDPPNSKDQKPSQFLKSPSVCTSEYEAKKKQNQPNKNNLKHLSQFLSAKRDQLEQEINIIPIPVLGSMDVQTLKRRKESLRLRQVDDWDILNQKNRNQRRQLKKLNP